MGVFHSPLHPAQLRGFYLLLIYGFCLPSFPPPISCFVFLPQHTHPVPAPHGEIKDQWDLSSCAALVLRVQFPITGQKHKPRTSGRHNPCNTADQQPQVSPLQESGQGHGCPQCPESCRGVLSMGLAALHPMGTSVTVPCLL